ncbi:MAG TPA: serine/threonine-protein kinase [Thermoanaerobaculia bacterium]|nr:serine/threonine-protein kinase [Thermoanaerobaculia bacterium]
MAPASGGSLDLGGESVGHIRILERLGAGGMGEVYVGFDETLRRRVALKAIHPRHRLRPGARARFLREARLLSQLDHPNICRIHDYQEGAERDFLVLELIEGEDLATAIRGGLDPALRLGVAEQVAEALAAAHAQGVVHRDLKPHNVMLTTAGRVKVLDFGLARSLDRDDGAAAEASADEGPATELLAPATLAPPAEALTEFGAAAATTMDPDRTAHGTVMGSPGYLSPEQARGEPATTASDMYAFGLLLQELFTGRPAHPPDLDVATLLARARGAETLAVTGVDPDVAALVARLLDPAPAARPTAIEALRRLRWVRDKPRRRLVRAAVVAVLALLALGGLKYTVDLRAARDEAERRRAQAEDLIGFMLGDLRDKLAPVGRLELLEDVGDKALAYFESLPTDDRTDDELFRRSQALRQIGQVRMDQGDLAAATQAFEESHRLANGLVERDPQRGEWLLGLGHADFWMGNVHWLQGDLPAALERFERYRAIARRLVRLDPESAGWRLEEGYAETNLAAVHEALGHADAALAALRRSLAIKRGLLRRDPDNAEWRRSLANGLSWLGSMLTTRGDLDGAAATFDREGAIRRALVAAEPESADARLLLAVNFSHRGKLGLLRGDLGLGREALGEARDLHQGLVARDPTNRDWQRDLAVTRHQLGEVLLAGGDPAAAERELAAAAALLGQLVEQDPSNSDWRRWRAATGTLSAAAALAEGRVDAAQREAEAARSALAGLAAATPGDRELARHLGRSQVELGRTLAAAGEEAAAHAAWERALEVLRPVADGSRDVEILDVWVRALLYLGRGPEATDAAARLAAAGYRRPDFVALCTREGVPAAAAAAPGQPGR